MIVINILIAILTLVGTLCAFGGETWKKGDEPILTRITTRGYISLTCLAITFILGIFREIKTTDQKEIAARENDRLKIQLRSLQDSLITSTKSIAKSSSQVQLKVDELKTSNCEGVEQAFKLAVNIPREYDDTVLHLNGELRIPVPGRITNPMEIYWGDKFEYSIMTGEDSVDLGSIKLQVGTITYDLYNGTNRNFYHGSVRIYGRSPKPMIAYILNPKHIRGVALKIFVKSTDATRGQQEFKKAVLSGDCSEFAKKVYKVINDDIVRLRSQANEKSSVRSTLTKGSFVRTLQILDEWTEVLTPENRQGWIKTNYLSVIQ